MPDREPAPQRASAPPSDAARDAREARLRAALASDEVELPPLPAVALEVSQLDPTDAATLSALIRRDVALATQVMRVANSSLYARAAPAASLQQAIARLGFEQVRALAIAAAAKSALFSGAEVRDAVALLWRESVATACFAQEIARLKRSSVESAYLGGLLHRVGLAVLYGRLARLAQCEPLDAPLLERLRPLLLEREAAVGARLVRAWRLPDAVGLCVARWSAPHTVLEAQRRPVLEVAVARVLAARLAAADQAAAGLLVPAADWLEQLNLYPDDLDLLMSRNEAIRATIASHD